MVKSVTGSPSRITWNEPNIEIESRGTGDITPQIDRGASVRRTVVRRSPGEAMRTASSPCLAFCQWLPIIPSSSSKAMVSGSSWRSWGSNETREDPNDGPDTVRDLFTGVPRRAAGVPGLEDSATVVLSQPKPGISESGLVFDVSFTMGWYHQ